MPRDEGSRLERMAGGFVSHFLRRQTAEFFIQDGDQLPGSFWIAVLHPFQNVRKLAQAFFNQFFRNQSLFWQH